MTVGIGAKEKVADASSVVKMDIAAAPKNCTKMEIVLRIVSLIWPQKQAKQVICALQSVTVCTKTLKKHKNYCVMTRVNIENKVLTFLPVIVGIKSIVQKVIQNVIASNYCVCFYFF